MIRRSASRLADDISAAEVWERREALHAAREVEPTTDELAALFAEIDAYADEVENADVRADAFYRDPDAERWS